MELQEFNEAMYLAQAKVAENIAYMDKYPHEYTDEDRSAATKLEKSVMAATRRIEAAVARIQGEFDNVELVKFGPLSINVSDDVLQILTGRR
ncbi:hypothetical protein [Eoetvoesiella caeni]